MGTLTKTAAALALAALLSGCAAGAMQDQLLFCDGTGPIRPAPGETARISDSLARQIAEHNAVGMDACGWRP